MHLTLCVWYPRLYTLCNKRIQEQSTSKAKRAINKEQPQPISNQVNLYHKNYKSLHLQYGICKKSSFFYHNRTCIRPVGETGQTQLACVFCTTKPLYVIDCTQENLHRENIHQTLSRISKKLFHATSIYNAINIVNSGTPF